MFMVLIAIAGYALALAAAGVVYVGLLFVFLRLISKPPRR